MGSPNADLSECLKDRPDQAKGVEGRRSGALSDLRSDHSKKRKSHRSSSKRGKKKSRHSDSSYKYKKRSSDPSRKGKSKRGKRQKRERDASSSSDGSGRGAISDSESGSDSFTSSDTSADSSDSDPEVNSPLQERLFKKDSSRAAPSSAAAASTVAASAAEPPETNQALKESKGKADKKLKDDSKKDRFVWTIEEDKVYSQYLHEQIRQNNTSLPYTASSPFFERAVADLLQDSVLATKLKAYEEACPHGKDRVKWVAQKLGDKYKSYERRFKALEAKLNKSGNGVGFEDEDDLCEKEGPELDNQSTPASATEGTAGALEAEPSASAKPKPRNKSTNWPFKSAEERRLYEEYWLDLWGATAAVIQPNRKNARAEASSAKGKAATAGGTAEGSADVSGAERTTRETDDARGIKKAGKAAGGRRRNSKEEEEDSGDDEDGPGLFSFMRWQKNFQEEGLRRRAEAEGASARLLEKAVSATQDLGHTIKTATAQGNALQIMTLASLTGRSPQEMALSMSDLSSLFMGQFNHQDSTRGSPSAQQPQGPANDTN